MQPLSVVVKMNKVGFWAATASVAVSLLIVGIALYMVAGAHWTSNEIARELQFSIFLEDDIQDEQRLNIETELRSMAEVESFTYISKAAAAADFREFIKSDFQTLIGSNPIPASYELRLKDNSGIAALETRVLALKGVQTTQYPEAMAQIVEKKMIEFNWILLGIGGVLLAISLVMIYNTLRLAMAASRQAIVTMKLVGATTSFIKRPYIRGAIIQGAVAGVISSAFLYGLTAMIQQMLPMFQFENRLIVLLGIFSLLITTGVVICTLFSYITVTKEINRI